jgi:hypothetical protein
MDAALPELRDDKPPPPFTDASRDEKHSADAASAEKISIAHAKFDPDADAAALDAALDTDRGAAPIITDGLDVSRYVVDARDDGGASITLRSVVVGTLMAGLGAALQQVRLHALVCMGRCACMARVCKSAADGATRICAQRAHSSVQPHCASADPAASPTAVHIQADRNKHQRYVRARAACRLRGCASKLTVTGPGGTGVFLLLVVYSLGTAWAAILPRKELVEGTRFAALAPVLHFVNPCDFGIKEVCDDRVAGSRRLTRLCVRVACRGDGHGEHGGVREHGGDELRRAAGACAATAPSRSRYVLAKLGAPHAQLFYDTNVHATTAVLATFSTACFGCVARSTLRTVQMLTARFRYGIVGLLRPLTVYPAEMVYWIVRPLSYTPRWCRAMNSHTTTANADGLRLPRSAVPSPRLARAHATPPPALHFDSARNAKRVRLFWLAFAALFAYEIFPAYIFPLLNGVSVVCLATQSAPPRALDVITNIFGGAEGNEGLGLLNLSFDWQVRVSSAVRLGPVDVVSRRAVHWFGVRFLLCAASRIAGSNVRYRYMSLPLTQQANAWVGYAISYVAIAAIYYSNAWNVSSLSIDWLPPPPADAHPPRVQNASDALDLALLCQRHKVQPVRHLHASELRGKPDGD